MPGLEKELMYKEILGKTKDMALFFSGFNGLKVGEIQRLRKNIRSINSVCFVAKKTLLQKLFKELGMEGLNGFLENNHTLITTAEEEPQRISKILVKFEKDFQKKFAVKGVFIDGELKDKQYVIGLSELPSREQLIAKLLGSMKAPANNLVFVLSGVTRSLVITLDQIKKQKEEQSNKS